MYCSSLGCYIVVQIWMITFNCDKARTLKCHAICRIYPETLLITFQDVHAARIIDIIHKQHSERILVLLGHDPFQEAANKLYFSKFDILDVLSDTQVIQKILSLGMKELS